MPAIELSHLTPAQKRAYILADNKLALNAGWDEDLLRIELGDLQAEGFDLGSDRLRPGEIASFLIDHTGGLTDPDDVPELPEHPGEPRWRRLAAGPAPPRLRRQHGSQRSSRRRWRASGRT